MTREDNPFPLAAAKTLTASRWTILAARIFGQKVIGRDGDCVCIARRWRGTLYLIDFKHMAHNPVVSRR